MRHHIHTTSRVRSVLPLLLVVAISATACGGASRPELTEPSPEVVGTEVAVAGPVGTESAGTESAGTESATDSTDAAATDEAAVPRQRAISIVDTLMVVDEPGSDAVIAALDARTDFGSARVLLVEEAAGDWVRVRLPIRPNDTTGWVRATDVELEEIDVVVHVDLERRELQVLRNGTLILLADIAVGSPDNPTPTGSFFVTDKLATPDPNGAYGPFALGLSAYSETLTEFAGGDGQIGLHGTNDLSSIGQAVSHGCVRLPNELITQLAELLPLGTPVTVQ